MTQVSKALLSTTILILALALSLPASAWEGVEVQESDGTLQIHFIADPSPVPGYCYWDKDPEDGPFFQANNTDGYGNMGCPYPWSVHCDGDSLVYRGSWPGIEGTLLRSAEYSVTLSCAVTVQAETRLAAARSVVGDLDNDEHSLTLINKDGTMLPILPRTGGPDEAQIILQPGTYTVILYVAAEQGTHIDRILYPYQGSVVMKWEDPAGVAVETSTWGGIKAIFR